MDTLAFAIVWAGTNHIVNTPLGQAVYWDTGAALGDTKAWQQKNPKLEGWFEIRSVWLKPSGEVAFRDTKPIRSADVGIVREGPYGEVEPLVNVVPLRAVM